MHNLLLDISAKHTRKPNKLDNKEMRPKIYINIIFIQFNTTSEYQIANLVSMKPEG